jgi:hypothetical protein
MSKIRTYFASVVIRSPTVYFAVGQTFQVLTAESYDLFRIWQSKYKIYKCYSRK